MKSGLSSTMRLWRLKWKFLVFWCFEDLKDGKKRRRGGALPYCKEDTDQTLNQK